MTLCSFANATIFLKNSKIDDGRGRIVWKVDDENARPRESLSIDPHQIIKKVAVLTKLNPTDFAACDDKAIHVNRVCRRGRQYHISRSDHRERQMGDALFGSDRDDGLTLRIQIDFVVPFVPRCDGVTKLGDALRRRIPVILRFPTGFDQLIDNVAGRRLIRVPHAKIDNVFTPMARLQLQSLDLREHIRRKSFDPVKSICHSHSIQSSCRRAPVFIGKDTNLSK